MELISHRLVVQDSGRPKRSSQILALAASSIRSGHYRRLRTALGALIPSLITGDGAGLVQGSARQGGRGGKISGLALMDAWRDIAERLRPPAAIGLLPP